MLLVLLLLLILLLLIAAVCRRNLMLLRRRWLNVLLMLLGLYRRLGNRSGNGYRDPAVNAEFRDRYRLTVAVRTYRKILRVD